MAEGPKPKQANMGKDIPGIDQILPYQFNDFPESAHPQTAGIEVLDQVKPNLKYLSYNEDGSVRVDENGHILTRNRYRTFRIEVCTFYNTLFWRILYVYITF